MHLLILDFSYVKILYNLIKNDSNIPKELRCKLNKFVDYKNEVVSWRQLFHNCKYRFDIDYDNVFKAYEISDIDFSYELHYKHIITCTYNRVFRFNYYVKGCKIKKEKLFVITEQEIHIICLKTFKTLEKILTINNPNGIFSCNNSEENY